MGLVYELGPDGRDGRLGVDCARCGHAARLDVHRERISVRCFVGCDEEDACKGLDLVAVARELIARRAAA